MRIFYCSDSAEKDGATAIAEGRLTTHAATAFLGVPPMRPLAAKLADELPSKLVDPLAYLCL